MNQIPVGSPAPGAFAGAAPGGIPGAASGAITPAFPGPARRGGRTPAGPLPGRIAIVSSRWHREIVDRALQALVETLAAGGIARDAIDHQAVPGAFELPLMARRLARSGRYDAVVACGLVVNGGIYRHEFVATAVIDGLMRVQLDTDVPVLSAVLTPRDFHDHAEHQRFFAEHFAVKGAEVGRACLQMVAGLDPIPEVAS